MAMIRLTVTGYPSDTMAPGKQVDPTDMLVNSDQILMMTEWHDPVGTRIRIPTTERDVVVSQTLDDIEALITG